MTRTDYLPDWSCPPSFGPIAHLVGHARTPGKNSSKLTDDEVSEIRRLRREKIKLAVIADMFDITVAHVSAIARGKTRADNISQLL